MPTPSPLSLPRAVVVVIRREDGRLLFIQRPANDHYAGYWNPVTGGEEAEDNGSLIATCLRETREEVGLEIRVRGKLWESVTERVHYALHWFAAEALDADPQPRLDLNEAADFRWVAAEAVAELAPSFADTRMFFQRLYPRALAAVNAAAR